MTCPVCGENLAGRAAGRVPPRYACCTGCSLAHLDPLPDAATATAHFGPTYFAGDGPGQYPDYAADEAVHRRNARRVLDVVEPGRRAGAARLLDVGCGYGFLLDEARRRGWDVAGVDPSGHAREQARHRFGLDIAPEVDALPGSSDFAAVTAVQVLHHVIDPSKLLAALSARMRVGGLLALETLDRSSSVARVLGRHWPLPAAPWTVWLFDRASLQRLLVRQGLKVLDVGAAHKRVSLGHLGSALAGRGSRRPNRRRPPALAQRLARLSLPYPFGDTILLLARKEAS